MKRVFLLLVALALAVAVFTSAEQADSAPAPAPAPQAPAQADGTAPAAPAFQPATMQAEGAPPETSAAQAQTSAPPQTGPAGQENQATASQNVIMPAQAEPPASASLGQSSQPSPAQNQISQQPVPKVEHELESASAISIIDERIANEPGSSAVHSELVSADEQVVQALADQIKATPEGSPVHRRIVGELIDFSKEEAAGAATTVDQVEIIASVEQDPAGLMQALLQGADARKILSQAMAKKASKSVAGPSATHCGGNTPGSCPDGMFCQNEGITTSGPFACQSIESTPGPGCTNVFCASGQTCNPSTGTCEGLPCGGSCSQGYVCVNDQCMATCEVTGCPAGNHCFTGNGAAYCTPDTCVQTGCPAGMTCNGRQCVDNRPWPPVVIQPDDPNPYDECIEHCLDAGHTPAYCGLLCSHLRNNRPTDPIGA